MLTIVAAALVMQRAPPAVSPPLIVNAPIVTAPGNRAVPAERLVAARALIALFNTEETLDRQAAVMAQVTAEAAIIAAEMEADDTIPPTAVERIHRAAQEDAQATFRRIRPAIETAIAEAYARAFTAEELQRLKVLMDDPLVHRMQELTPVIMRDAMGASIADAMAAVAADDRMARAIEEWRESLSAPAPSS